MLRMMLLEEKERIVPVGLAVVLIGLNLVNPTKHSVDVIGTVLVAVYYNGTVLLHLRQYES